MSHSRYVMVFRHNQFQKRLYFEGPADQGQKFAASVGSVSAEAQQYPSYHQALAFIEESMARNGFTRIEK